MTLLGSLRSRAGLGSSCSRSTSLGFGLLLLDLTSATDTRSGNVVGVDVNGKVLESVAVDGALLGVGLGESHDVGVVLGEVVDDLLADGGDMKNTVQQIGGPVSVELGGGDGVATVADRIEILADLEREAADDSFGGSVVTSPVASPLYEIVSRYSECTSHVELTVLSGAVAVRVVAAEEYAGLVSVDDTVVPADRRSSATVTKVTSDELRVMTVSENMVFGVLSELDSLVKTSGELTVESRVAGLMDRVILDPALGPLVSGMRGLGGLRSRLSLGGGLTANDGSGNGGSEKSESHGGGLEHHLD